MKLAKMPDGTPEIYMAFQGEGQTIGKPIVFVRCSICNLHCKFCDTFYTWNFEGTPWEHNFAGKVNQVYEQMDITPLEVATACKEVGNHVKSVVFTGGEPTIQQIDLIEVMKELPDWYIEIETNGTLLLKDEFAIRINQINCSPKLSSSGNDRLESRNVPKVIKQFIELWQFGKGLCFKFVVAPETLIKDLDEIQKWQKQYKIPNELIYLMPEGVTTERIIEGSKLLAEVCKDKGYSLSTRLQVILYGTKRAV